MARRKAADNSNLGMLITLSVATLLFEITNEVVMADPIPKTDVGSDVRSDVGSEVGTDVGNDVGTDVGTYVGSDPKIRRDFIFERNGKISIDFFCLFIYFIFLFLGENISKANSKKEIS